MELTKEQRIKLEEWFVTTKVGEWIDQDFDGGELDFIFTNGIKGAKDYTDEELWETWKLYEDDSEFTDSFRRQLIAPK